MRRFWLYPALIAGAMMVLPGLARAGDGDDTVFLKSGGRRVGTVVQEDAITGVRLRMPDGSIRQYPPKDVDHVDHAKKEVPPLPAPPRAEPVVTVPTPTDDPQLQRARDLFKEGTELAKKTEWAEALQAFEQSAALRRHAITTYNIGVCQRALGQYTQARSVLQKSLDESAANSNELPPSLASEAKGYLSEIDTLLVTLDVTIKPADAKVIVDGRPLKVEGAANPPTVVAGLAPPGPGQALPAPRVNLIIGPGTHLFTLSRQGFGDVVVSKTYGPGAREALSLAAEQLPATLHVSSNLKGAAVSLDGLDVGLAPIDVTRPGGSYSLLVRHEGYIPYKTQVKAEPGAMLNLSADLTAEGTPVTKRWWFWTGAAAIVAGAVVATYFLTRPTAERPPVDGGGLNWALKTP